MSKAAQNQIVFSLENNTDKLQNNQSVLDISHCFMKYQMLQVNNWEVSAGLRIIAVISTQKKNPNKPGCLPEKAATREP